MLSKEELKKIPILSTLEDSALRALVDIAREREFAAETVIFTEGSEDSSLLVILSGKVRITKATASGEAKSIAVLSEGSFFGEMALFDDYFRSATATAVGQVRALQVSRDAFIEFLTSAAEGASRLLLEIMRALAPRIRQTNLELVSLYEAGRVIGKGGEAGEILSGLLAVLEQATSCTRGAAFLINPAAGVLECRAAFGYEDDPSGWTEPLEGGIGEQILRAAGSIAIENCLKDAHFQSIHSRQGRGYETDSMLGAALTVAGASIGMIVLCDKVGRDGDRIQFTAGDSNILAGIAAQASGAVESARLHEEAREREKLDRVYFRF